MAARKATKPMETDDAIVNIGYFDNRLDKLKGEIIDSLEKALKAHAETEAEAITGIWRAIHWRDAVFVGSLSVVAIIISIMSGLVSLSACSPMPSPPQQTAIALNGTYQAEATATWKSSATDLPSFEGTLSAPMATYTPTPSPQPSPSPSLTSSIVEVTPVPTYSGPIDLGVPLNQLYGLLHHKGWYIPDDDENLRLCPSKNCDIVGTLLGGHKYPIVGSVHNEDGTGWLCEVISEDTHGAEYCLYTVLLWDDVHGYWGTYIPETTNDK